VSHPTRSFRVAGLEELRVIRENQEGHYVIKIQTDVDVPAFSLTVVMRLLPDRGCPWVRYLRRVTEEQYKTLGERLYGPENIDRLMEVIQVDEEDNKEDDNSEDDDRDDPDAEWQVILSGELCYVCMSIDLAYTNTCLAISKLCNMWLPSWQILNFCSRDNCGSKVC
jgi:hypothetical protein